MKLIKAISLILLGAYRTVGTSQLGGGCRFTPSCSEFALHCFHRFSFAKALRLSARRILSCRPGGPFGYDPLPDEGKNNGSK